MPGPLPKPPSKRRRTNVPKSYGAAEPTTAPAAPVDRGELGFDAHPLVVRMWAALGESVESRFFSRADWERARWEMWFADQTLRRPTPTAWQQVQKGLSAMLVSPADKRRAAIELKAVGSDPDEVSATSMMGTYRSKLASVKPIATE